MSERLSTAQQLKSLPKITTDFYKPFLKSSLLTLIDLLFDHTNKRGKNLWPLTASLEALFLQHLGFHVIKRTLSKL